jgi:sporulation protein YlmC with PRC-barrel domain
MKRPDAFALVAAFALANVAYAQVQPGSPKPISASSAQQQDAVSFPRGSGVSAASMDAKWLSTIVGMKVETPAGMRLGTVKDVVLDGYGRATHAIVSYGGMMGLGNRYTAVPWTSIAEMLHGDRLLMDQGQLENAPTLSGARPDSANTHWRREAESYWRGKVAMGGPAWITAPGAPGARAPASQSAIPPRERAQ